MLELGLGLELGTSSLSDGGVGCIDRLHYFYKATELIVVCWQPG